MGWLNTRRSAATASLDDAAAEIGGAVAGGSGAMISLSRGASLRKTAAETMPLMGAAMILFFLAAMIEGFLSPSAAPLAVKRAVAWVSTGLLIFYFLGLGFPRKRGRQGEPSRATG